MNKVIITTGAIAILGGLATAVAVSSCDPDCEIDGTPSVVVHLVDEDAAERTIVRTGATKVWYEYTNEYGEVVEEEADCVNDACSEVVLGHGEPGRYTFHALVCEREYTSSIEIELNGEGCRATTETIDLAVGTYDCPDVAAPGPGDPHPDRPVAAPDDPEPGLWWKAPDDPKCTLEARFSVVTSVLGELDDSRVAPLSPERVYYIHDPRHEGKGHDKGEGEGHEKAIGEGHHKNDEIPGMCLNEECTMFAAGVELEGEFIVGAEACGQVVEATVAVGRTEDGCHVSTEGAKLMFDARKCETRVREATLNPPNCPSTAPLPSAYIMPVVQEGDLLRPVPTKALTYTFRDDDTDRQAKAFCAHRVTSELCSLWVAGWGLTGPFSAYTTVCGEETAVDYTVERSADGCGPVTRWLPVEVDTSGCIQASGPEGTPPPGTPSGPDSVTNSEGTRPPGTPSGADSVTE